MPTSSERIEKVLNLLSKESDRGLVLVGAAFVDTLLEELLTKYFVDDSENSKALLDNMGALSTFSSRIRLAYALGLISKDDFIDLNLLRKIRNDCAHSDEDINLEMSPHCDRINELRGFKQSLSLFEKHLGFKATEDGDTPRNKLILVCAMLSVWLRLRTLNIVNKESPDFNRQKIKLFRVANSIKEN